MIVGGVPVILSATLSPTPVSHLPRLDHLSSRVLSFHVQDRRDSDWRRRRRLMRTLRHLGDRPEVIIELAYQYLILNNQLIEVVSGSNSDSFYSYIYILRLMVLL